MKISKKIKNIIVVSIGVLLLLTLVMGVGFYIYASDYYEADEVALEVYEEGIENGTMIEVNNMIIIQPEEPIDIGIIFYPGAKVEAIAYLPLLQQLAEEGFTTVLIEMPFNFAFLNVNAADDVFELVEEGSIEVLSETTEWYIMGHSLGGAMASSYAESNQDIIEGLIVIGAYVYGDYPTSQALTIYGTLNDNLESSIDYTDNIVIIEGGNHAQYGNYGLQDGDPEATITDVEQQAITVESILQFVMD